MNLFSVYDLRCNYKKNPVGIDDSSPRLSWKIRSEARGFEQAAYQIQVAKDEKFSEPLVWDTGKQESDKSVHIEYGGPALLSRKRYYCRVRVWNRSGAVSDWCDTAYWETAFFSPSEWTADWITLPLPTDDQGNEPCHYIRKSFEISREVVSARAYATSLGLYRLYVNGETADDTQFNPDWTSYNKRLQYQTYDITSHLVKGVNAIGLMLGNGWYKGCLAWENKRDWYGNTRAALLQIHIVYSDGSEEVVGSDGTWRGSSGALLMSELYHGETYDARLQQADWNLPDFNDAGWTPVTLFDHPKSALLAQENEQARIVETIIPIGIMTTPRGETVIDMGQNMVGWVRFTVEAEAGTVVTLQHAEVLDREGNFYTGNLRSARQTVTYICSGQGEETFEPTFSFQGFRYVKVDGIPVELLTGRFIGCVISSDLEQTGSFRCSDELLNRLQSNIVWGQKGNFLDVPTDCPQRDERLGWTGDAQVFIRTAAFNMNVAPFFEKWLKDLAADQHADGGVPHVIPDIPVAGCNSAAWGDASVICPWTLYECYGDIRVLEAQYPSMRKWVEYIRAQGENEFLWNTGFHFGDWLGLDAKENSYIGATPKDLIATAFYSYSTQLLAKTATVLGKGEDAAAYGELHDNIVQAFRQEFVTPNGRVASPTQTAYVLALMFDLLEEKDRGRTARMLADHIEENGTHLTTGFVGTPYLCHVLTRFGYKELAYRLVLQKEYPSWLYSVVQGATTIWEHWDGIKPDGTFWSDDMNSYNHYAYGAIGDWLYRTVAGIDTVEAKPGYKKIRIRPLLSESLRSAEASFESMYGEIRSAWSKREDGGIRFEITIPANASAEVILPAVKVEDVRESGKPLKETEGLVQACLSEEGVILLISSGIYRFDTVRSAV